MASSQPAQQRIGDFYVEVVLPALAERLDSAFPEFGWKRDARGWVATNQEITHRLFGARAERVVAHRPAPRGFLVHGDDSTLWTAYVNGGDVPRGETFASVLRQIAPFSTRLLPLLARHRQAALRPGLRQGEIVASALDCYLREREC